MNVWGDRGSVDGDDGTDASVKVHVLADVGEECWGAGDLRRTGGGVGEEGGFFTFESETTCCVYAGELYCDRVGEEAWCRRGCRRGFQVCQWRGID